jgi:hypothetical protein
LFPVKQYVETRVKAPLHCSSQADDYKRNSGMLVASYATCHLHIEHVLFEADLCVVLSKPTVSAKGVC